MATAKESAPKKAAAPKKEAAPKTAAPKKEVAPKNEAVSDAASKKAVPKKKVYHVMVHPEGGWQVKAEGNEKATIRVKTKEEALKKAADMSKTHGTKPVPHKKDGKIQKTKY